MVLTAPSHPSRVWSLAASNARKAAIRSPPNDRGDVGGWAMPVGNQTVYAFRRLVGMALAVVVVTALLSLALILQSAVGVPIFAALALALSVVAAALRWAFAVAAWRSDRRDVGDA